MSLSEICVRRPVFAFMLIMFLVTLGVFSFLDLGVDLFPRTDPATVYVRVKLPGASPEEVVSQIVLPLEETVASVSGIEEMRAMVSEGGANIIVTFVLEREIGGATEDVREKVSAAMRKRSLAQAPRSMLLQCSLQNGRQGLAGSNRAFCPQVGQSTRGGSFRIVQSAAEREFECGVFAGWLVAALLVLLHEADGHHQAVAGDFRYQA